jgi:hypothetical protein
MQALSFHSKFHSPFGDVDFTGQIIPEPQACWASRSCISSQLIYEPPWSQPDKVHHP